MKNLNFKICVTLAIITIVAVFFAYSAELAEQPKYMCPNAYDVLTSSEAQAAAWSPESEKNQDLATAWGYEVRSSQKRYGITDAERWEIASVVTAEAVGEPFAGKMAVAQCILQACEDDGIRPSKALTKYGYSKNRPEPCAEALEAVKSVFDRGDKVTAEPIKYFYAPALVYSDWHESQVHVITINNHKFFKEKGAQTNGKSN